jgi:5-methylcytosine-specific restriction protein A
MPPRACIVCGKASEPGASRFSKHQTSNWERHRPAHASVYRTREWTDLRARVLREEPVCAEEGCSERSTSVDHIVPLSEGGAPYDRSNLRGMCYPHHRRRSSRQGAETRKRNRQRRGEEGDG